MQVNQNDDSFHDLVDVTYLADEGDEGFSATRVRDLIFGLREIEGFEGTVALAGLPSTTGGIALMNTSGALAPRRKRANLRNAKAKKVFAKPGQ